MMHDAITIEHAARILRAGEPVAFPTETVYGLGANALDDRAVAAVYALKQRPRFNPLIVHVPDAQAAARYVQWNERAGMLAARFWPGPLALVLPRREEGGISLLASAGLDSLAVRAPSHLLAQALMASAGVPVAAPSANRSGRVSPTEAAHVREEFGGRVPLLDGGRCTIGLESTVVDLTAEYPVILRPGAVTAQMLEEALGSPVHGAENDNIRIRAPGMLQSHYAPTLPVRLNATELKPGEALLAFGAGVPEEAAEVMNLSGKGDLAEAAANLFACLRRLDRPEFTGIAIMPIPEQGLGIAINDRLRRASVR